jgi:hypothetical protein
MVAGLQTTDDLGLEGHSTIVERVRGVAVWPQISDMSPSLLSPLLVFPG